MSKYHDDTTFASSPGGLRLSVAKLEALEPELLGERTFKCSPVCPVDHPAREVRERVDEHLQLGDSRAAKVVSLEPLVVAALSDDLDAVALLEFPATLVTRYGLALGTRLLTVNTYGDVRAGRTRKPWYAVDLVPGPQRRAWSNFEPFIADFLSDDQQKIEARKAAISDEEWERVDRLAEIRITRMGLDTARPGKPSKAGWPVRTRGLRYYQPIEHFDAVPSSVPRKLLYALAALGLLGFLYLSMR